MRCHAGTIRVLDILILTKDADGTVEAIELSDVENLGPLQLLEAELASCSPRRTWSTSPPRWSRAARPGC